jgi:hypothetical protein
LNERQKKRERELRTKGGERSRAESRGRGKGLQQRKRRDGGRQRNVAGKRRKKFAYERRKRPKPGLIKSEVAEEQGATQGSLGSFLANTKPNNASSIPTQRSRIPSALQNANG